MKLTNKHIGRSVWLVPEGNEVRSRGREAIEGRVVEMRRTRGVIEIGGFLPSFTAKPTRPGHDYIETTLNGGFIVLETRAQVDDMIEAAPLRSKIDRALHSLPADKILAIADIAGVR